MPGKRSGSGHRHMQGPGGGVPSSVVAEQRVTPRAAMGADPRGVQPADDDPTRVRLFDDRGRSIVVLAEEAASFLEEGWTRVRVDPVALHERLHVLFASAQQAVDAYVGATLDRAHVDARPEAEHDVAEQAMATLIEAWFELHNALRSGRYPILHAADADD